MTATVDEVFTRLLPTAARVARRLERAWGKPPGELGTQAMMGAWVAATQWDPARNPNLRAWGTWKIQCWVIDEERIDSNLPRYDKWPLDEFGDRVAPAAEVSLDAHSPGVALVAGAEPGFAAAEDRWMVDWVLARAHQGDAELLARSYLHGDTLAAIGEDLGVSESRVCQLRRAAIKRTTAACT